MNIRVLYTCREYAQYITKTDVSIIPIRDRWFDETLGSHYVLLDQVRHGIGFNIEMGSYAYSLRKGAVW